MLKVLIKKEKTDILFLFKLSSNGIYSREKYDVTKIVDILKHLYGEAGMPNGNIKNKRTNFVWAPEVINSIECGKWIPVQTEY
jgi:hypothetical protein